MVFQRQLSNGDIIGQFINKVGTTNAVVRIAKLQGLFVALISDNTSTTSFVLVSKEKLLEYIALTGTAANRVVLTGTISQDEITNLADNNALQGFTLAGAYTLGLRPVTSTEISLSGGYLEVDTNTILSENVPFNTLLVIAKAQYQVLKENGLQKKVDIVLNRLL